MAPIERVIYKVCGIDPKEEMNWKQFLKALLILNAFWFVWGMVLLVSQGWLPLNPDGNGPQTPDQAFNTCISFMVNCNLQHYSGESGLTYFTQLFVIMLFQFITAATGMAAMAGIMKSMAAKTTKTIGNFWHFLVVSCTRILLPLSLIVGFILILQGTPMGFDGKMKVTTPRRTGTDGFARTCGCHCAYQTIRNKWRRLLWCELFSSVGKSDLSYQYGGVLVYLDYSDGNGIGIRVLYS